MPVCYNSRFAVAKSNKGTTNKDTEKNYRARRYVENIFPVVLYVYSLSDKSHMTQNCRHYIDSVRINKM
jgi:hypothetical protein